MFDCLKNWLQLPDARRVDLDAPEAVALHRRIIQRKPFLYKLYREWYQLLMSRTAGLPRGPRLEVGSGGGFLREVAPGVLSSEVVPVDAIDLVLRAEALPFPPSCLSTIYLVDVLHHIPQPALFFREAQRGLRPGGRIIMIEPASTTWSRFVWRRLHHEPFDPGAGWTLPAGGPMSGANGALPWILFERDRARFDKEFPELRLVELTRLMPLAYLLSGGVSMRSFVPGWSYKAVRGLEKALGLLNPWCAMFELVVLEKRADC